MALDWMFATSDNPDPHSAEMTALSEALWQGENWPIDTPAASMAMPPLRDWFEQMCEATDVLDGPGPDTLVFEAYLLNSFGERLAVLRFDPRDGAYSETWLHRRLLDIGPFDHV